MADEEIEGRTTADRFYLLCKVVKKKLSYREHQSRGKEWNETADVIFLVPEQTTESDVFHSVWLPPKLTPEEVKLLPQAQVYPEFMMEAGEPVCGYFRGYASWGSTLVPKPHIFVMTKKAEERLQKHVGKKINITVLGDVEEEKIYQAKAETRDPYA